MNIRNSCLLSAAFAVVAVSGFAEIQDRPTGIKIGQRLTLRPYVNFEFTYDSNPDQQGETKSCTSWMINPHLNLEYKSERFNADLSLFYGYRAYNDHPRQENGHDYGENLNLAWTSSAPGEKGWTILLTERFQQVNEDDNIQENNGNGLWRNRREFQIQGAVQRRFNEKLHADIHGNYYFLDYDNDMDEYQALYGWQRLLAGAEIGYAASKWTDIIISGNYQSYTQDNDYDLTGGSKWTGTHNNYARESQGYTAMIGLQSYATEKITYRLLGGWSRFEYAGGESTSDGFTYSVSADWKITDTWQTMLLAQSYYQPDERQYGSANRVDAVSWGLSHSMIRGKLRAVLDVAYRRETRQYTDVSSQDYDEDIFSGRLGFDYTINRFLAVFIRGEYQKALFNGDFRGYDRDYDRFRATVGFRLQY